ncbi:neuroguidin isoform X2 [Mastacembelus armatus]|uniref:neuroguidin isoform X2 n=1 Tax=Mastacembelus armatus TaxID=205130 RepID=UPI000E45C6D6|nr:neuroguidin isoform X2 [Mastacembelus armatus]
MAADNGAIRRDLPTAVQLLNNLTEQVVSVTSHVHGLLLKVKDGTFKTSQGLSFLDLRYHLLLFYLQDLTHLISIKTEGEKIKESKALDRLVRIRTVFEKMRPLDHRLKYQIDKLVCTAVTGSLAENDLLQLRPNPDNLISKLCETDGSEDGDDKQVASEKKADLGNGRKYVPPKIVPVHYDGDVLETDRRKTQVEHHRRAALRSSMIQELRQQYSDTPEEIRDRRDFQSERESREEINRKNYEESMMVRLSVPKTSRKRGVMAMSSQLSGITHFSDITVLMGSQGGQDGKNGCPKKKKKVMKKKPNRRGCLNADIHSKLCFSCRLYLHFEVCSIALWLGGIFTFITLGVGV